MAGDSDAVCLDIAVHHGIDGESGNRLDAQLLGDVLPMGDDSGQTDVQLLGNFLIYQTLCNQDEYLYLTGRLFLSIFCRYMGRMRTGHSVMPSFTQLQDILHQLVLRTTDIQCRHRKG